MAIKLRLHLRNPQSVLLLKAVVFAGALGLLKIGGLSTLPVLFFLALSSYLYFKPPAQSSNYLIAFLVLVFLGFRSSFFFANYPDFLLVLGLGLLFYLILGLKNLLFVYRSRWHYLLILVLNYLIFIAFLTADKSDYFFFKAGGIFLLVFLLWREFFRVAPWASITAVAAVETLWAASLLPLNPLGAANLTLIVVFAVTDLIRRSSENKLSPQAALTDVSILIVLIILIFMTSRWSI